MSAPQLVLTRVAELAGGAASRGRQMSVASTAAFALTEGQGAHEHEAKNTICLWFEKTRMMRRASTPPPFRTVR